MILESAAYTKQQGVNRRSHPADDLGSLEEEYKEPTAWDSKAHLTQL